MSSQDGTTAVYLISSAYRFTLKISAIDFDGIIGCADIEVRVVKQNVVQGHFGTCVGQSGVDSQRAVGSGAQAKESIGDDRGQKGTFVKLVVDAKPAAGPAALQCRASFVALIVFPIAAFSMGSADNAKPGASGRSDGARTPDRPSS